MKSRGGANHAVYEYVAFLSAALKMADVPKPPQLPVNVLLQDAFLAHLRNLSELFHQGVKQFKQHRSHPVERPRDDIYAVDFCGAVTWDETPFAPDSRLRKAINKTLSHLTYSRDLNAPRSGIEIAFDGKDHAHGTVKLVMRTWNDFMLGVSPEYRPAVERCLRDQAAGWKLQLDRFEAEFDRRVRRWGWRMNNTPND